MDPKGIQLGEPGQEDIGESLHRLPIVGGNWNNGANAGVFALNLNNHRGNSNHNIGLRVDLSQW